MKKKILCFDLDNVICKTNKNKEYKKSKPLKKNIKLVNDLYNFNKFVIKNYTARGMGRFDGNLTKAEKKFLKLTIKQLKQWKVSYDFLIMGKTSYDLFVDDKAFGFSKDWEKKSDLVF